MKKKLLELARSTPASRPQELLRVITNETYAEAYTDGINLSLLLDRCDPSVDHTDGLDAFQRVVRAAGINPASAPELGLSAHPLSEFEKNENTRALIPEVIARMWRKAVTGREPSTRSVLLSSDNAPGTVLNQYAYDQRPRYTQIAPAIPLNEVVAFNTGITGRVYQAFYMRPDVENIRMKRVAEAAEVPAAKLVGQPTTIQLHKYGRRLDTSYEVLRSMPIDLVAFHIQRIAIQAEVDKVVSIIAMLISGDGNANTAATVYANSSLDPTTAAGQPNAGKVTLRSWLAFKLLFLNPYQITTVLATNAVALDLQLLNTGTANIPLLFLQNMLNSGGFRPINPGLADNVALGHTADAPANKVLGFDKRFAVERVFEIGANIQEVNRWVERQVQVLVMTETEGYDILDAKAVKILDIAA